ncbi:glycosyltransferase family protein [Desulfogranum mediterraneum]|uniref:glycosyltransferase family protein n=1 Tax=Desulfogranum mediterraneum TaxID=160661 RepID=UPI0004018951|nr:glycosyltransferase [Desulfogranum mediterraneum]
MRILVYCQHVLGIGHLVRTFEILRGLKGHQLTLLLGGAASSIPLPAGVELVQLPPLMMDPAFSGLRSEANRPLEEIKAERCRLIQETFSRIRPEILFIELYPFGRNSFHFELAPLLRHARTERPDCLIASGVRDILVERDNQQKFEQRVIDRLNSSFDLLLIHSDPALIRLEETFSRMNDIRVEVVYTGYVHRPAAWDRDDRPPGSPAAQADEPPLIIASAGGGSVGFALLEATCRAHGLLAGQTRLHLYTGPYLGEEKRQRLQRLAAPLATVATFAVDLPGELRRAALSVSMGGYNTTMDVISAGCPGLIYPFAQNREQGLRAERLQALAPIITLKPGDLEPERLAGLMQQALGLPTGPTRIRLGGGPYSAKALLAAARRKQGLEPERT